MSPLGLGHDPNKINPHHIWIDFVFVHIHICRTLECTTFRDTECIEWMSMRLISAITHLDEYKKISITCYDVDLSSFDLVVPLYNGISLSFQILHSNVFSCISDGATGRKHRGNRIQCTKHSAQNTVHTVETYSFIFLIIL
jgi:hypothetical protein